ncbi:MAG: hypothetical protein P4L28_04990 [Paludibacteraceae bacterium]|nr:hypothetical protein [Paludibacteraceae bacterium]
MIKRFENLMLRPAQVAFVVFLVASAIKTMWDGVALSFFEILYLGYIGQSLHPKETTRGLFKKRMGEYQIGDEEINKMFLSKACTHYGIMIGIFMLFFLHGHISWYFYIPVTLFSVCLIGGALKFVYVIHYNDI